MHADHLALELAATIRHDGHGGTTDDLADPAGLTRWVRDRSAALGGEVRVGGAELAAYAADTGAIAAVADIRTAVRALFARAVLPADADRRLPAQQALDRLNAASARVPVTPRLDWPPDGPPTAHHTPLGVPTPADQLAAALARAAITFLTGPERTLLRACPAPRCIRYFVKEHPRQQWCKPSCGNRARVARHTARHRDTSI